jgi:hypothetical protein
MLMVDSGGYSLCRADHTEYETVVSIVGTRRRTVQITLCYEAILLGDPDASIEKSREWTTEH